MPQVKRARLAVVALPPGQTTTLQHGLSVGGQPVKPTDVRPDSPTAIGETAADTTSVTFKNHGTENESAVFLAAYDEQPEHFWAGGAAGVGVVEQPISAARYGVVGDWNGATGTNNYTALAAAINAAVSQKRPLYLSRGKYLVALPPGVGFIAGADLELRGDGVGKTLIKITEDNGNDPENPTQPQNLLVANPGVRLLVTGIEFTGPNVQSTAGGCHVVFHYAGTGETRLVDVKARKVFMLAKSEGGNQLLHLERCDVQASGNCALATDTGSTPTATSRLIATDCTFEVTTEITNPAERGHCLYLNHGVAYWIERCRFIAAPAEYMVHTYGSVSGVDPVDDVHVIRDCVFGADCAVNILTHPTQPTRIEGCVLAGDDLQVYVRGGGAEISGCRFKGATTYGVIDWYGAASRVWIHHSTFDGAFAAAAVYRQTSHANAWRVEDCTVRNTAAGSAGAFGAAYGGVTTLDIAFRRCHFSGGYGAGAQLMFLYGGRVTVEDCVDESLSPIYVPASNGPVELVYRRNRVLGFGLTLQPANLLTLTGEDNLWQSGPGSGPLIYSPASVQIKGHLRPAARIGDPVASAPTVTLRPDADTVHVTGTAAISVVQIDGGDPAHAKRCFQGPFRLVADDAWSLVDAGNVKLKTSPRQLAANEVVSLLFDGSVTAPDGSQGTWFVM